MAELSVSFCSKKSRCGMELLLILYHDCGEKDFSWPCCAFAGAPDGFHHPPRGEWGLSCPYPPVWAAPTHMLTDATAELPGDGVMWALCSAPPRQCFARISGGN